MKKFYLIGSKKQKVQVEDMAGYMSKYLNSKKGKETKKKYNEANKELIKKYNREYQKKKREERAELGLCIVCGTAKSKDTKVCGKCRELSNERCRLWRKRLE